MNLMPAGPVAEVMAGGGPGRDEVHAFLKMCHHADSRDGVSYVALGVIEGRVWLLAGGDADALEEVLREADASDAEIIELRNLQ